MDRMKAEQIALHQIDPGERLLWSGSPAAGAAALRALPAVLVGIPFASFAVFWIWSAWSMTSHGKSPGGPWSFFPLFGVPFVLVGLGVMMAPLWAYLAAGKTVYAVTDKRALIIGGGGLIIGGHGHIIGGGGVQSYSPASMDEIARFERSDGTGSVYFASRETTTRRGGYRRVRIGFEGIPDVRQVEHLLREQLARKAA